MRAYLPTRTSVRIAFTADILEGGLNSELIEVADGHMIAFRVLQHRESKPRPLDEVSREIREFMRLRKAAEQAAAKGEELLAQLHGGMRLEELSDRHSLERVHYGALHREDDRVPARIMNRAFTLAHPDAGHVLGGWCAPGRWQLRTAGTACGT